MAIGFDLLVAERVVELRNQYDDLCLMAVVPFRGQSDNWCIIHREKYEQLIAQSNEVIVLSEHYFKGCLLRCNDYMIDHCSTLLAYYDGGYKGGTFYTCRKAQTKGL